MSVIKWTRNVRNWDTFLAVGRAKVSRTFWHWGVLPVWIMVGQGANCPCSRCMGRGWGWMQHFLPSLMGPGRQNVGWKIVIIFLNISWNIWFGISKELSHWGGYFEFPQHMIWLWNSATQNIKFLISQPKHMLWVLNRTVSLRRFFWPPKTYFKTDSTILRP